MATRNQYNYDRRAHTEMPNNDEAFDINALPDQAEMNAADEVDDIDFGNYKGIYANDDNG